MSNRTASFLAGVVAVVAINGLTAHGAFLPAPGWGGMVMLDVTLSGSAVSVAAQPASPTIVLQSRPDGSFDPSAAWAVLNGTAYSRRLGWYDPNEGVAGSQIGDLLPAGDSIWIKVVTQSPELKTYAVSESDNTTPYTPIFGTSGSDSKWQWDGKMDHNANAVSLADLAIPDQVFAANYKVYVGDSSGNEVSGYTAASETWTWTGPSSVPEPALLTPLGAAGLALVARRRRTNS